MKASRTVLVALVLLGLLLFKLLTVPKAPKGSSPIARAPYTTNVVLDPASAKLMGGIGFETPRKLAEHYEKHGAEFGQITQDEYLRMAQALRDDVLGGNVEELRRDDGVTCRFNKSSGAFIAFNRDRTIRTFFKPNDGENYFRRQATR